ncbi:hypothetical protein D3C81_1246130 [compost metagenome]
MVAGRRREVPGAPVGHPVTVIAIVRVYHVATLPLLVRYRHPRLWTEVWITVGLSLAVAGFAMLLRVAWLLVLLRMTLALMRAVAIVPLRWAGLGEAGQWYAEHQGSAEHGEGLSHRMSILCMFTSGGFQRDADYG